MPAEDRPSPATPSPQWASTTASVTSTTNLATTDAPTPLHHSASRSSLRSLGASSGGSSRLREPLQVTAPRSTSPKISSGQIDAPLTTTTMAAGGTDAGADAGYVSAPVSGRVTPASRKGRGSEKAALLSLLATDPKWRKYTALVDKSLATFDSVKEWADFISFLSKLLKTLQAHPTFTEIPRKLIVAKRLSQCLTPALPSGVHQRALDVYSHIFGVIGTEGLKRDLQIWSAGLFPFFQYAATSVKPSLISIYETYYLPMQEALRPAMKAFILALLPGLDEEGSESFDKIVSLLDFLSMTVSPPFFLQNLWLILISMPSARTTALSYLSRRMPKMDQGEDIASIVGPDVGLMVRAFSSSLEDENNLVQRGTLDLLVTSLRLDGAASSKHTREPDRVILMRSASAVVLRRDLSLSRRLYTWILGPDENPDHQVSYLCANALDLLRVSLLEDMRAVPSAFGEASEPQRPYRIFISLLDKYEIGYALTDVLVLDALGALEAAISSGDPDNLATVGLMFYEAVDPYLLWRRLFHALKAAFNGEDTHYPLRLVSFVLRTFSHDEEVTHLHLPVIFVSLLELIQSATPTSPKLLPQAFDLALQILSFIPLSVFSSSLASPPPADADYSRSSTALSHAEAFYSLSLGLGRPAEPDYPGFSGSTLFQASCESLIRTCELQAGRQDGASSTTVIGALRLLRAILDCGKAAELEEIEVAWSPEEWTQSIASLFAKPARFDVVSATVEASLALSQAPLHPRLELNARQSATLLIDGIFRYLDASTAIYHIPAAELVRSLENVISHLHLNSVISQRLNSPIVSERLRAIDAFGVLWRHNEDSTTPVVCQDGIFSIFDSLKHEDLAVKRAAETWLRSNLRSYVRVLEPILATLLDPRVSRTSISSVFGGREVRGFRYERPFDLAKGHYMLACLGALSQVGGVAFNRALKATKAKALGPRVVERAQKACLLHADATCTDVLVDILVRIIQSEPSPKLVASMASSNPRFQLSALDLVQSIVSRGEISAISLKTTETAVVGKLFEAVHIGRLEGQNQLLHALHTIITVSTSSSLAAARKKAAAVTSQRMDRRATTGNRLSTSSKEEKETSAAVDENDTLSGNLSPLLMQTIVDGISTQTNRPILQHWIDFIMSTIPQFRGHLRPLLLPLCDAIIAQLRRLILDIHFSLSALPTDTDLALSTSDAEIVMLISPLEKIVTLTLGQLPAHSTSVRKESSASDVTAGDASTGLFGYVSTVWGLDDQASAKARDEGIMPRSAGQRCFDDAIQVLRALWTSSNARTRLPPLQPLFSSTPGILFLSDQSRKRCHKALEGLYRLQPLEVVQVLSDCWAAGDANLGLPGSNDDGPFEILDLLAPSAQSVVSMICQIWTSSSPTVTTSAHVRPTLRGHTVDHGEPVIYAFLETYISRLEGPIAVQVWSTYIALAKEILQNVTMPAYRSQVFPALRCLTALASKVASTSALEDKRLRRELQETYGKLLEASLGMASRSLEAVPPQYRWSKDPTNGTTTPMEEKTAGLAGQVPPPLYLKISEHITRRVLPNLRLFMHDNDKASALCSSISYQIVSPALRSRGSKFLDIHPVIFEMLQQMIAIPGAIKSWRAPVADSFNDASFFNAPPASGQLWRPLVKALMDSEKDRMAELIARAAAPPSANIFTNREAEMLLRSLNIRRLSFVLFSAERNHFLLQLPSIQERLVELLRTNIVSPMVHSEVYLCLRVLICRVAPRELSNLWPIILTELLRVFEQLVDELPPDGSDQLDLVLSACKFLDLLLVVQSEDFQIHQWMFVCDTVEAAGITSSESAPESLMDRLAEIVSDSTHYHHARTFTSDSFYRSTNGGASSDLSSLLRRPFLSSLRHITSISELAPFFSQASLTSYESLYSSASVDWDAVDAGLEAEMFDAPSLA